MKKKRKRTQHCATPWRKMAEQWLPEFIVTAKRVETPMEFWSKLRKAFEKAYPAPRNESLIEHIYGFAGWCMTAPRNKDAAHDPSTAVAICFLEDIPEMEDARLDMPRWFTLGEILEKKSILSGNIGEVSFSELVEYFRQDSRMYRPWWQSPPP